MIAVMAIHGGVTWASGGFLGVDAFFVLSGFLITTLLVMEWQRTGTIRLRAFWARRARRLLPALFTVLAAVCLYAAFVAEPMTEPLIRGQSLSTMFYVANWQIWQASTTHNYLYLVPTPLYQAWSLGIEEQFYLVWPLIVLAVLHWRRSIRPILPIAIVGTIASAIAMAILFHSSANHYRAYYGTDTRAQEILIGAALAIILLRHGNTNNPRVRAKFLLAGLAAVGVLAWAWVGLTDESPFLYHGGFALIGIAVALVIACCMRVPRSPISRVLSIRPFRYVGRISYGLYLWHWLVFQTLTQPHIGLGGDSLLAVRFAATFAVGVPTYHLIERPIREGTFLRGARAWVVTPIAFVVLAAAILAATA